jgi:WD40 repeat protein
MVRPQWFTWSISSLTHIERRSKDHSRSINTLSVSPVVHYYCITGSTDGDMRIWVRSRLGTEDHEADSPPGPQGSFKVSDEGTAVQCRPEFGLFALCMAAITSCCGLGQWLHSAV